MTTQVQIISENKYSDGSYAALARHYGFEYAVHYIANEIRVYGVSKKRISGWQANKNGLDVREFFKQRIESFGPEFQKAHNFLYDVR